MSSHPTEHSVLIALRELDSLEQQRRDDEAARERARLAAEATARAEAEARVRAEQAARARAVAEAEAEAAAERDRRAHAIHIRNLEVEARLRGEQAARLQRVQAEIDVQLHRHSRREMAGQRAVLAVVLAVVGLAGALGAMVLTQPRGSVVADAFADADDLRHMAALKEYAAAIDGMEQDLGRLRDDNHRQSAVIDAAASLRVMMQQPDVPVTTVKPKPRPRPQAPEPGKKPPGGKIVICDTNDPLKEDC
jgi:hypothetical protein